MGTNVRIMKAISLDLYKRLISNQPGGSNALYGERVQPEFNQGIQSGYGNPTFDGLPSQLVIGDAEHPTTKTLLESIPENQRPRSKRLINLILANNSITWGPSGEIKFHGKVIPKSNIVDLISAATNPTKMRRLKMVGLKEFIMFLKEVNAPKYFLGNDFLKLMDAQDDVNNCQQWITFENSSLVK
jgi:hypothetical protein